MPRLALPRVFPSAYASGFRREEGERPAMGYGESEAVLGALRYEAVVPVVRAGAESHGAVR